MNLLTSRLNKARTALCPGAQPTSPASPERRGGGTGAGWYTRLQAALNNKTAIRFAKYLIPITILLFFLLLSLTSCKTPATLTNDTQHHTRDSNYHASIQRIETHDTIVIGIPSTLPLCRGSRRGSCEGWGGSSSPSLCREGWGGSSISLSPRRFRLRRGRVRRVRHQYGRLPSGSPSHCRRTLSCRRR